jgi:hypothetical protein
MGGLYGNAAATALEDCPEEARGLMSGILQQGVGGTILLVVPYSQLTWISTLLGIFSVPRLHEVSWIQLLTTGALSSGSVLVRPCYLSSGVSCSLRPKPTESVSA